MTKDLPSKNIAKPSLFRRLLHPENLFKSTVRGEVISTKPAVAPRPRIRQIILNMENTCVDAFARFFFFLKNPVTYKQLAADKEEETNKVIQQAATKFPKGAKKEKLIEIAKEEKILFCDTEFPACYDSLFLLDPLESNKGGASAEVLTSDDKPDVVWRRPREFLNLPEGEKINIFEGAIEPDDICQGQLGDCWLLCSIASLVSHGYKIEKYIFDLEECDTEIGHYKIKLYRDGNLNSIVMDDYIPCLPYAGPIYSKANGNELWVMMLEKAFAKLHGSYAVIRNGWAHEALMDLTGHPCVDFHIQDDSIQEQIANGLLWNELIYFNSKNYIMTLSTPGEDVSTETGDKNAIDEKQQGLVPGHAYSLLRVVDIQGNKLCQVRNPWGSFEWLGDWGDDSQLWTDELKEALNFQKKDDGLFWISYDDLVKHFSAINVCYCRTPELNDLKWYDFRDTIELDFDEEGLNFVEFFEVELIEDSEIVFTIHQKDKRTILSPPYIDIGLTLLLERDDGSFHFIAASGNTVERQQQLHLGTSENNSEKLPAGKYLLIPTSSGCRMRAYAQSFPKSTDMSNKIDTHQRTLTLSVHSSSQSFTHKKIPFSQKVYEIAMDYPIIHMGSQINLFEDDSVILYMLKSGYNGIAYVAFNNMPKDKILLELDFTNSKNVITEDGKLTHAVYLHPGEKKCVRHVMPSDETQAWSCGWGVSATINPSEKEIGKAIPNINSAEDNYDESNQPIIE